MLDASQATQAALERLIQRPKLSDKLLSKPPFRFLHDIISEVEKATGFSAGLYGADLSDSAQVKDKAAKVRTQHVHSSVLVLHSM
jgi:TRAF3-interacting protein 1